MAGYRIESTLGRGGMGVVYLAEDLQLQRKVALKVLAPELAGDERFRERFIRESRLAASLDHPNIITVYEARETNGLLYIAMRYVRGTDLKSLIMREGPLDPPRTFSILEQAAAGLDAAHAEGLIHRDVKPGNVLLTPREHAGDQDRVYLSDFGLTKRATSDSGITATGQFVGTLDYAAPEQFEGKPLTAATDVYSLGCVLYECLTGELPFPREQEAALMYAHLLSPPPRVTEKRPALSTGLDKVVARALAKSPEERFPSCGELVRAARVEQGEVVSATPLPPASAESRRGPRSRRKRAWLGVGVAALVALMVVAAVLIASRSSNPKAGGPGSASAVAGSAFGIESTSGRTIFKARIGKSTNAVAVGRGSVWVADRTDDVVVRLDETTGREQARITIAGGPRRVTVDDSVPGVWVMTGLSVWGIDPITNEVNKTIPLEAHATDIAVGEGAVWVSVTRSGGEAVVRVDPSTGATRYIGSLSGNLGTSGVAVGGGAVWVIGPSVPLNGDVVKIDPSPAEAEKPIPLRTPAAAITFGDGAVWVLAPNGALSPIDPKTDRAEVVLDAGNGVTDLAAGEGSVWVTAGHSLIRIDTQAGKIAATIDLKARITAVAVGGTAVWASTDP